MKVGIDVTQVQYGTGVPRYTSELVKALLGVDSQNEYILFGSSLRGYNRLFAFYRSIEQKDRVRVKFIKMPVSALEIIWNKFHKWPIERLIGEVDIFHSSDWAQPPTKAIKVTTIHDLGPLIYPNLYHPKIVEAQKRRLAWVEKEVDKIICVSNSTKADLLKFYKIDPAKIKVIYEAASKIFQPAGSKLISDIKQKYKISGDYLISVATEAPHKNLKLLINSTEEIYKKFGLKMVLVGRYGWGEKNLKSHKGNIISTGFITDADLVALYSGARCFVLPSTHEGFGLPILEAMACGCPVASSNVSSLPEVGGDVAFYFDPSDQSSLISAISKIVGLKEPEYKKLKLASISQSSKFSWTNAAIQTLELYEKNI